MNAKRKAPAPIIDNLDYLNNPLKQKQFDASQFIYKAITSADIDLEYALKFLYSYNDSKRHL